MLNHLFSPFTLRGKTIKNRCTVTAMVTNFCTGDGKATERFIKYHETKAEGGWGLIITEDYVVEPTGKGFSNVAGLWCDKQIPGHSELTRRVHAHGATILAQIYHCGRQTNHNVIGRVPYAPSAIPCPFSPDMPEELSTEKIYSLIEDFGDCAARAKKCGFDGVEIHGGHGYLVAEFMSPYSNKRSDEFGGDLASRLRFPMEIIKNIRRKCGDDFIIGFRISADEYIDGGRTLADTLVIAPILEEAGIEIIHVSAGCYASCDAIVPPAHTKHAWTSHMAEAVKKVCSIPVITVGRVNDPRIADMLIKTGQADFVGMGRASLVDPAMPLKAHEGRFEDIRRCIGCNFGCLGLLFEDKPISCVLNPTLGREHECAIRKTNNPKNVIVVGAGPAGLEAAITAALAGHHVEVLEKDSRAGGQFRLAAVPPCKGEIADFITWQTTQLKKLGISVRYNTEATIETVKALSPDVVVVATGSTPSVPPVPGIRLPHVVTAHEVLSGASNVGMRNVIIGGGLVGAETAHHLAVQLKQVTLVEMLPEIAAGEALAPKWHLMRALEKYHVRIITEAKVKEVTEQNVVVEHQGQTLSIPADTVIVATGSKPNHALADELAAAGVEVRVIGDALKVGLVMEATAQGLAAGNSL